MKQSSTLYASEPPIFQHAGLVVLPGGFRLVTDGLVAGSVIPAGAAFVADAIARTATLIKSDIVFEAAANNATQIKVAKGTQLKAGDFVTVKGGTKSIDVTAVDYSNATYDLVTLSATLGSALTVGSGLIQATAAAAQSAVAKASGLTYNSVKVETNNTLTLVAGGSVYQRRIPAVSDDIKAALPNIIFLQSK